MTFEKDFVTVAPESSIKVSVTFTPPTNLPKNEHWFYSGWLEVIPLDETMPKMSVPYGKYTYIYIFNYYLYTILELL